MKVRMLPYQIQDILHGRHENLHKNLLGIDITEKQVEPITRNVFFVNHKDKIGIELLKENQPARCLFETGHIFCIYAKAVPLTEIRLVHEFIHRIARREGLFGWTSGVCKNKSWTLVNEGLTEYITRCVCVPYYNRQVDRRNRYLPLLPKIQKIEDERGREKIIRAYLENDTGFFKKYIDRREEIYQFL